MLMNNINQYKKFNNLTVICLSTKPSKQCIYDTATLKFQYTKIAVFSISNFWIADTYTQHSDLYKSDQDLASTNMPCKICKIW